MEYARPRRVAAGIDIGGTTTSVVLVDPDGTVVAEAHTDTPARHGGPAMLAAAVHMVESVLRGGRFQLTAAGAGAAGVINPVDGTIIAASDSFHAWAGFPLARELRAALRVPVVVENDVNAFIEGERHSGAGRGLHDVLGITLGTGVGGALVLGGALYTGPNGAAGEIGHVPGFGDRPCSCARSGHLETLASGPSIVRRYRELSGMAEHAVPDVTVDRWHDGGGGPGADSGATSAVDGRFRVASAADVAALARAGVAPAVVAFEEAGRAVARAAVMVATLVDVTHVVVGGGVAGAWDLLEPAIKFGVAAEPPVSDQPVVVMPGLLGHRAVAVGAAVLAAHLP